jgi:putative salt-induced outer membrane protein YdiY
MILLATVLLLSDQIVLKNGDRYSGRLERVEGGNVTFVAEYAGALTLPWDAVQTLVSRETFVVQLKNGGIESAPAERIAELRPDIAVIRSPAEQRRLDRQAQIARAAVWSGSGDIGFSLARGNAETSTLTSALNATRISDKGKLGIYGASIFSTANRDGQKLTSANLRRGGMRYDRNLNEQKRFTFVSADLDHNPVQGLNLRSVLGAGFGQHVKADKQTTLDLFAGGTYNREEFTTGVRRDSAEALLSEASTHKVNGTFSLSQRVAVYPNLTETGTYRLTVDSSAVTTILRWLAWQVTVSNRYLSNPPAGTRPNDLLVTTGFRVNFGPKRAQ